MSIDIYQISREYWDKVPATLYGMLGGYEHISNIDINTSKKFIKTLFQDKIITNALDCGAGIGRVTKGLLIPLSEHVDLVESNLKFLNEAQTYLEGNPKVGQYINCGLESFVPSPDTYDVIWCQWVLTHLKDEDLVAFFERAKLGLRRTYEANPASPAPDRPTAFVVVKENVSSRRDVREYDSTDGSFTRPREEFLAIFRRAGLKVFREQVQPKFPPDLYKVITFALY